MSYEQALTKVLEAAHAGEDGPGHLSTGEKLFAALALNRPDWLHRMDYTIADAIERVGPEWMSYLPRIVKAVASDRDREAHARRLEGTVTAIAQLAAAGAGAGTRDDPLHFQAELITVGEAPGYRDASLVVELAPSGSKSRFVAQLRLRPEDGEDIVRHILKVHAFAWSTPRGPIDKREDEQRPRWIDARL